jgi:hypothetical protein
VLGRKGSRPELPTHQVLPKERRLSLHSESKGVKKKEEENQAKEGKGRSGSVILKERSGSLSLKPEKGTLANNKQVDKSEKKKGLALDLTRSVPHLPTVHKPRGKRGTGVIEG